MCVENVTGNRTRKKVGKNQVDVNVAFCLPYCVISGGTMIIGNTGRNVVLSLTVLLYLMPAAVRALSPS